MGFEHDYHEVVELIESMLVFVLNELQTRPIYKSHLAAVQKIYRCARPFHVGLDEDGKVVRTSFLEAKRILRDEIGIAADDHRNFT